MVIHLQTSVALLCQRFSTWTVSMDHGRMDSHTNADLCSSKPFTISLKGQLLIFFFFFCVFNDFDQQFSNECTGVCCQEILSGWASGLCSHRKDWILPVHNNNSSSNNKTRHRILPTLQPPFQPGTVICRFHFRFSSTESRLFAPASTSVNIQSYVKRPTGI